MNVNVDEENSRLQVAVTAETVSKLAAIGATGINFRFVASLTWIGTFIESTGKYAQSFARANVYDDGFASPGVTDDLEITYTLRPAPPQGWPAIAAARMGVLIALPYREINGEVHTLQEHCSFKAFALADGPVN